MQNSDPININPPPSIQRSLGGIPSMIREPEPQVGQIWKGEWELLQYTARMKVHKILTIGKLITEYADKKGISGESFIAKGSFWDQKILVFLILNDKNGQPFAPGQEKMYFLPLQKWKQLAQYDRRELESQSGGKRITRKKTQRRRR